MMTNKAGQIVRGQLANTIETIVATRGIDIVSIDPFVKSHSVDENSNSAIDDVMQVLTDLSSKYGVAVDIPHHVSKGAADPGNANRGRGASAAKDAGRLIYTLTIMSSEEAERFGIREERRKFYLRMDSGKVNITPPATSAKWFELRGVLLDNGSALYPNGDDVQTVEPWTPPDIWLGLDVSMLNRILTQIDAGLPDGNRYTDASRSGERGAWRAVLKHTEHHTEKQAREIIKAWVRDGVLVSEEYTNPSTRKLVRGLRLDPKKRPR